MDFITEWITNIILFVLIATIIDLLLPNSSLQKYTKMVAGLLLITIILSPIIRLVTTDIEKMFEPFVEGGKIGDFQLEQMIDLQKKEIQAFHHAYILEEIKNQLKASVQEELMNDYQLEILEIDLVVDEESNEQFPLNIKEIYVALDEAKGDRHAIEVVKKVEINTKAPLPSEKLRQNQEQLASLLSNRWGIDEELIHVTVEGGSS